jgi:putative PIN family toxin of toxin-antitoxin system
MKVVLDTNILLMALPSRSRYHAIIQAFNRSIYQLIITTQIFTEYEEILSVKANRDIANIVLGAFLEAPNVIGTNIYYYWQLITADPDDNKFIDACINGQADYLVTNDAHFNVVKNINFPKINIITADEFLEILNNTN